MTQLINQLMNDEAVYRTAPATPGLLIIMLICLFLRRERMGPERKGIGYQCVFFVPKSSVLFGQIPLQE